ncbi:unnamed protein product [Zymoseptoria tritici ST99CH_3D7]|uniref:Uncharacterized protein n=1 Tax=Zymoseptoria tritici (strain ST99CH_3D7) TaxID=1276538 RepID=A0A1X7S2D8_ZYMT9|nr:unnamed protein product [Zymoseptoria tritici ST99CH_3D7]
MVLGELRASSRSTSFHAAGNIFDDPVSHRGAKLTQSIKDVTSTGWCGCLGGNGLNGAALTGNAMQRPTGHSFEGLDPRANGVRKEATTTRLLVHHLRLEERTRSYWLRIRSWL